MGVAVSPRLFALAGRLRGRGVLLATALVFCFVLAAIAGEQACALGGLGAALDRLSIGLGMIPRGEVGLIFANLGLSLTVHGERVVDPGSFSAVVIMVVLTTLVTPPALKWSLGRRERRIAPAACAGKAAA